MLWAIVIFSSPCLNSIPAGNIKSQNLSSEWINTPNLICKIYPMTEQTPINDCRCTNSEKKNEKPSPTPRHFVYFLHTCANLWIINSIHIFHEPLRSCPCNGPGRERKMSAWKITVAVMPSIKLDFCTSCKMCSGKDTHQSSGIAKGFGQIITHRHSTCFTAKWLETPRGWWMPLAGLFFGNKDCWNSPAEKKTKTVHHKYCNQLYWTGKILLLAA